VLIKNNTSVDYWLGPIRLPANATGFSFDDTTETSLYLLHDEIADTVNTLALSNMITCTSTATPFPRPTGVPAVLHGDGSPNGLVYAPQGSIYMRRDNSGASNSLYVKNSGIESNTGWGVIVVGSINGITGILDPSATILGGTGFTAVHTGVGLYTVTFNTAFAANPVVVVTALSTSDITAVLNGLPATTGFEIATYFAGALADEYSNFIAIEVQ
jgi:hypothetical protein